MNQVNRLLWKGNLIQANSLLQCSSIELDTSELDDESFTNIISNIDNSLDISCTATTMQQNVRSILNISTDLNRRRIKELITLFTKYERCLIGVEDITYHDITEIQSNILDIPQNDEELHESRCFVEITRGLRTLPKICGEQLDNIITPNIKIQSRIEYSNSKNNMIFQVDDSASITIPPNTVYNSNSECISGDFAIYTTDAFQVEDQPYEIFHF